MYVPYHLNTFFAKFMTFGSEFLNFRFFQRSGQVMPRVSRSPRSQYKILARNTHHLVLSFYLYIFSIYILYIYPLYIFSIYIFSLYIYSLYIFSIYILYTYSLYIFSIYILGIFFGKMHPLKNFKFFYDEKKINFFTQSISSKKFFPEIFK